MPGPSAFGITTPTPQNSGPPSPSAVLTPSLIFLRPLSSQSLYTAPSPRNPAPTFPWLLQASGETQAPKRPFIEPLCKSCISPAPNWALFLPFLALFLSIAPTSTYVFLISLFWNVSSLRAETLLLLYRQLLKQCQVQGRVSDPWIPCWSTSLSQLLAFSALWLRFIVSLFFKKASTVPYYRSSSYVWNVKLLP